MGIKANFTKQDVEGVFGAFLEEIEASIIERLQMLGEMVVTHAKGISPDKGFMDQTGNLRSSIGYVIYHDGRFVSGNFAQVKEGNEGMKTGQALTEEIGKKYSEGYVLIVVAGMNYAVYLESMNRDVLTSAELMARTELPKMLEKLVTNIKKTIS